MSLTVGQIDHHLIVSGPGVGTGATRIQGARAFNGHPHILPLAPELWTRQAVNDSDGLQSKSHKHGFNHVTSHKIQTLFKHFFCLVQ